MSRRRGKHRRQNKNRQKQEPVQQQPKKAKVSKQSVDWSQVHADDLLIIAELLADEDEVTGLERQKYMDNAREIIRAITERDPK